MWRTKSGCWPILTRVHVYFSTLGIVFQDKVMQRVSELAVNAEQTTWCCKLSGNPTTLSASFPSAPICLILNGVYPELVIADSHVICAGDDTRCRGCCLAKEVTAGPCCPMTMMVLGLCILIPGLASRGKSSKLRSKPHWVC